MADNNVVNLGDAAVIRRLKEKPISYSVNLTHMVSAGEWVLGMEIVGLSEMDAETRACVVFDLRQAADMAEKAEHWEAVP